jgi:phytoene dehydrogenase-like protein
MNKHVNKCWDVVIIGGGLSGLVAANDLGEQNLKVLVIEKGKTLGGLARTDVREGCSFNLGPHAFYKGGPGMKILKDWNISLKGNSMKLNGKVMDKGTLHSSPLAPSTLISSGLLSWKEKKEWMSLLWKLLKIDPTRIGYETIEEWSIKNVSSEQVRKMLYMLCRLSTYSHAPKIVSAKAVLAQVQNSLKGVLYVDGGWQTIVDQLKARAISYGVEFVTGTAVRQIKGAAPNLEVDLSDDKKIQTEFVISTASPTEFLHFFQQEIPSHLQKMIEAAKPIKGACLDVALKKLPNPNLHFALGLDQPYYYSNHSHAAKLTQNADHVVLHVHKYLTLDENGDASSLREELENWLEFIQPGWKDEVITTRFMPSITISHRIPMNVHQKIIEEPYLGIPGVYLAGDWVSPDAMLADGAMKSGKICAEKIIKSRKEITLC